MKELTCDLCGSTELIMSEGVIACQTCGTKYSKEKGRRSITEKRSALSCIKCNMKGLEQGPNEGLVCSKCGTVYSSGEVLAMECLEAARGNEVFIVSTANCTGCGKSVGLPFMFKRDRPIYCMDCISTKQPPKENLGDMATNENESQTENTKNDNKTVAAVIIGIILLIIIGMVSANS